MRISQLDGRLVALWGWGREGRAAYRAIRSRLPALTLTLFCAADEVADALALADAALSIETDATAARLSAFDVVIKSPGISPYRDEAIAAAAQGTRFIGGTALWFAEHAGSDGIVANTVCVTGTKGKSTTSALIAHLLRAGGHVTALAGNIGLPLLELLDPPQSPAYWVIELSSYQTGDVADSGARPEIAVVLNVFPEHLDWHGSQARYVDDKLRLVTAAQPRVAVLNAADPTLAALAAGAAERAGGASALSTATPGKDPVNGQVRWFGDRSGWHLRDDGLYRGERFVMDTTGLPLPGRHNRSNLCAVLTAIEAIGLDAIALAPHAATFRPLPNRLQTLGTSEGITYVNDSISTTPHASLAALDCFAGHRVAVLLGGHDRGIDWGAFADAMKLRAPAVIVTMGSNGPAIHALLEPLAGTAGFALEAALGLSDAMEKAQVALRAAPGQRAGVMLLSPGAPSFGQYRDYVARGRHFAELAGFDPDRISAIAGLGIA